MRRFFLPVTMVAAVALLASPDPAWAYVGPGLGAGTLAVVLGLIGSVLVAVFAMLWYPIKRLLRKRKRPVDDADPQPGA